MHGSVKQALLALLIYGVIKNSYTTYTDMVTTSVNKERATYIIYLDFC